MKETAIKAAVRKYLSEIGAYWFMPVQMGIGASSLDFLVCYHGRFYGIETKRPGVNSCTRRQKSVMQQIEQSGGVTCLENSVTLETVKKMLAAHL